VKKIRFSSPSFKRKLPTHLHRKGESFRRKNHDKHFVLLSIGKIIWLSALHSTSTAGSKTHSSRLADFTRSDISGHYILLDFRVQHFLEEQSCLGDFKHRELDSGEIPSTKSDLNIKHFYSQFIPNAVIFFIVLVTAESSRLTIQSVGYWIAELDLKLKYFHVSFTRSNNRTKQLSLFALLRKLNVK
jgi:hypothetical protein